MLVPKHRKEKKIFHGVLSSGYNCQNPSLHSPNTTGSAGVGAGAVDKAGAAA